MRIVGTSDIHSPKYIKLFKEKLKEISTMLHKADLFILAGDIIDRGKIDSCNLIVESIRKYYSGKIYGVRGNEEYDDRKDALFKKCRDIIWLEDNYVMIEEIKTVIIGSRGALDKPTIWQRKNIPNIDTLYREKINRLSYMLKKFLNKKYYVILVTHYAPRCKTLKGEKYSAWPYLSSTKLTALIKKYQPNLVLHGHAHLSIIHKDKIGRSIIYNVALPATKKIVIVDTEKTILDFIS